MYTKDEIQCIAEIAQEHDLFILSDEVYREFVYDGLEYISFGNIPEIQDRVILIDSISKDLALVVPESELSYVKIKN